jgi:hypothetical protein
MAGVKTARPVFIIAGTNLSTLSIAVSLRRHLYSADVLLKPSSEYIFITKESAFQAGVPRSEVEDSLFYCSEDGDFYGYVKYVNYCGAHKCVAGGVGKDDYCI